MFFLITLLFSFFSCTTTEVTDRKQINFIPDAQMNGLGVQAYQDVLSKEKVSQDPKLNEMASRIGKRIAAASGASFDWEFKVIDKPDMVNAFCLPGGKVAVYTGILSVAKTEHALAAVIGHEVAHATARHGAERMSQGLLLQSGLILTDFMLNDNKNKSMILGALGVGAQLGVMLPFSRSHESEADRIGTIYMAKAGYQPHSAVELWQRMAEHSKGLELPEFVSTHPSNQTRIRDLANLEAEVAQVYQASEKQKDAAIQF